MGSRPEINVFIRQMTDANMQRLLKLNEKQRIFNENYGPFALCNRKRVTLNEQLEAQKTAYNEILQYVGKVKIMNIWINFSKIFQSDIYILRYL